MMAQDDEPLVSKTIKMWVIGGVIGVVITGVAAAVSGHAEQVNKNTASLAQFKNTASALAKSVAQLSERLPETFPPVETQRHIQQLQSNQMHMQRLLDTIQSDVRDIKKLFMRMEGGPPGRQQ